MLNWLVEEKGIAPHTPESRHPPASSSYRSLRCG
jgi:hypothetical protein